MATVNGEHVNNALLPNIMALLALGIDPKTKLPKKLVEGEGACLKQNIKSLLRIMDEQDAIRRGVWHNLPEGLTGDLIERVLWYRGQGMLFYLDTDEKFYFLPYTLSGKLDAYGRYLTVTPLLFNGSEDGGKEKPFITGKTFDPIYDIKLDEVKWEDITGKCVLLSDYSRQLSQKVLPRQQLNDPLLDVMAECIPMCRTALYNGTGINAWEVGSADEASNVYVANATIKAAALSGDRAVPVIGTMPFQDLTGGNLANAEIFLQIMQSLDNFRLSTYGLENGGLFEKKAHELQTEADMNTRKGSRALQDSITNRQEFCDMANSLYGTEIWYEPSETEVGDLNMDGTGYDTTADDMIEGGSDNVE